ncbi:hypothetical protein ACQKKX_02650 [Neorhizobium sp. NPDC001467]|uniref:hypothetical protein n=1 Tax=Neorhizobium sp. NPDC001467 TaxID=3390595 RepID=UPI003D02C854
MLSILRLTTFRIWPRVGKAVLRRAGHTHPLDPECMPESLLRDIGLADGHGGRGASLERNGSGSRPVRSMPLRPPL